MPTSIVIGGGPAGSTAAILLARGGWRVSLLEQHRFPRDKVCGECLSGEGIDVIRRLGLADRFEAMRPARLAHVALHPPRGPSVILDLPRPMWGLSRRVFDDVLLTAAREAGAEVFQPFRCEAITPGPQPSITVRDLVTNRIESMHADCITVADGKGIFPGFRSAATGVFGIQAHLQLDGPPHTIELFGVNGHYGGISPLEDGAFNLAFTVPRARLGDGNFDVLLATIAEENPMLAHRLRNAKLARPWLAVPLPRFGIQPAWPPSIIPIGNAAAAIEPIGGEGMGLAMRSAELAAQAILKPVTASEAAASGVDASGADPSGSDAPKMPASADNTHHPLYKLRQQYHRLWTRRAIACRLAGLTASSPTLAETVATILAHNRPLQRAAMSLLGKHQK